MRCVQRLAPSLACSQNPAPYSIPQMLAKPAMKFGLPSVPILGAQGTKEHSQIPTAPLGNPPRRAMTTPSASCHRWSLRAGARNRELGAMRSCSGHVTATASVTLVHSLKQSGSVTFKPVFSPSSLSSPPAPFTPRDRVKSLRPWRVWLHRLWFKGWGRKEGRSGKKESETENHA